MNKSTVLGLAAGVLAFLVGVSLASIGNAEEAVAPTAPVADVADFYPNPDSGAQQVNPLLVRHMSPHVCFVNEIDKAAESLGTVPLGYAKVGANMLQEIIPDYLGAEPNRLVIMSIIFTANKDDPACGVLAFTYAKKFDIEAATPVPAAKPNKKKQ